MASKNVPYSQLLQTIKASYLESSTNKVRVIDTYLVFIGLVALVQIAYCALVGSFPFNSFLAGLVSCAAMFCFTVSLRLQLGRNEDFMKRSEEQAFAEYVFCCLVLFLVVFSYIG